jgi:hypothetical protein
MNSGENFRPCKGFKLPDLSNLNFSVCLIPSVLPAVGERFKVKFEKLLKIISK